MNIEELRVGNLVYYHNSSDIPCIVLAIDEDKETGTTQYCLAPLDSDNKGTGIKNFYESRYIHGMPIQNWMLTVLDFQPFVEDGQEAEKYIKYQSCGGQSYDITIEKQADGHWKLATCPATPLEKERTISYVHELQNVLGITLSYRSMPKDTKVNLVN